MMELMSGLNSGFSQQHEKANAKNGLEIGMTKGMLGSLANLEMWFPFSSKTSEFERT